MALSPIWSRAYPVDYFTVSAIAQILPGLLFGWSTFAFHQAVHTPQESRSSLAIVVVAHAFCCATSLALAVACALGSEWLAARVLKHPELEGFLWVAPLILFSTMSSAVLDAWMARNRRFREMANAQFIQTTVTPVLPAIGLIAPERTNFILASVVVGALSGMAARVALSGVIGDLRSARLSIEGIGLVVRRHWNFPRDVLPSNVLTSLAIQLPQIAVAKFFSMESVGQYARVGTLLTIPYSVAIKPLSAFFAQAGGKAYREQGDCRREFLTCLKRALLWMTPFYIFVGFAAPWLYPWFYGPAWADAGRLAQPMALFFWAGAVASPVAEVMNFGRNTKWDVLWQAIRLPAIAGALVAGALSENLLYTLWCLALANASVYALYVCMAYSLSRRPR